MAAVWRTARVFLSSTFKDMHAERDWLVNRVFPALREQLEPMRIHLVDIDLRWGVTKEQAENDEVLDICLTQIDECRPFFLGMLGERYGWVPDAVPENVTAKWAWVQALTGTSVTELEILHGVLGNPAMRGHAMFCFRDPAFMADLPPKMRADMSEADAGPRDRLLALKQAIRDSGLPLFENYPCRYAGLRLNLGLLADAVSAADRAALAAAARDRIVRPEEWAKLPAHLQAVVEKTGVVHLEGLEAFGARVFAWLLESILKELKAAGPAAEPDPLAEELGHHERFMESRVRVYVGRENLQRSLVDFAAGEAEGPCLVTAPSGAGKSAALAKFVLDYARAHPATLVIPHFVGASPASTSLRAMLLRFCQTLKQAFAFPDDVPADTNGLITTFRKFLDAVPAGRQVVLAIDALNQLDEADNAQGLAWLPWRTPGHVKVVLSCIADPGRAEPALEAMAHRPHTAVPVEPLTAAERRQILKEVPSLSAKALDSPQVQALLDNPATANPLFLLVALEELRGFGSYEQLNRRIATFPREGETVTALFLQVIDRLEGEFDPAAVRDLLTLLASARRGLSDRELLDVLEGKSVPIADSRGDLFPVLRQVRAYLQHRGPLRDFFHRNLPKAVRDMYLSADPARGAAHARLAAYFAGQDYFMESLDEQRARAKRLPPTPRPANVRKVDELPWQLLQVAKLLGRDDAASPHWDAVADLFTDLNFLEAKAEAVA